MTQTIRPQTPHEMVDTGLLESLSMQDFKVDQKLIDEALGSEPRPATLPMMQQGGLNHGGEQSNMPAYPAQFNGHGSPISQWVNPWN